MVNLLRVLIVLSATLALTTTVLPFNHPLDVDLPLDGVPPTWVFGFLCMILAAIVGIPAIIGLFRLRRWGRFLGALVAIAAALGALVTVRSPIAAAAGPEITALLGAGLFAWCCGVCLSFHPAVAAQLRA